MLGGDYVPVERASATLVPSHDWVFIGASTGTLHVMSAGGRTHYRYAAGAPVESRPAVDTVHNELYLGAEDGVVHALRASDGEVRWKDDAGGSLSQAPVLTEDAVYVVTAAGRVVAFARKDGELLWTYRRDNPEGFSIAGYAGLTEADGVLYTGFADGTVVALDAGDGHVVWERDTALDLPEPEGSAPQLTDVDTTPVVTDQHVYVASFSGGLYQLARSSGSVVVRKPEHTGGLGLALRGSHLILTSADVGVLHIDLDTPEQKVSWRRPIRRGAPTTPVIAGAIVLVGESDGSLLALSLLSGRELARIDAGNGFSATPSVAGSRGFVLSDGGTFYAFSVGR
jgi:outer membrane protein assembly factor BamB